MIAQRTCAQNNIKTKTFDLIYVFSGRTRFLVIFIFSISPSLVHSQPLHLPAERFPCGSSNLTCQRWGYTACVKPDGEYYCLPCDHEYLRTLCGTKEEVQGCNLYCTENKVNIEIKKLQSDFFRQTKDIKSNFTTILADVQEDFFKKLRDREAKLKICQTDRDLYINRTKSLEKELSKEGYFTKCLKWILGGLASSYVAAGVCLVIWCLKCRKRDKTSADIETPEQLVPLKQVASNRSVSEWSEESEVKKEVPCPIVLDNATQSENDNVNASSKGKESEQLTDEQNNKCVNNGCSTKAMFQNVPPASENGFDKMAIQRQDHDCTLNKQAPII
ncbi:uncharacterized protein LOC123564670 [Mercenaria mercenaria]|uniref:uncharacterized protein LOC123564670 n=1 Tax=Mercenaria mercenaria TaxID=6596 RepID=UPI00234E80C5|nr:uncharacterized protein LOC123564670 [Mercenaria mercenaria]